MPSWTHLIRFIAIEDNQIHLGQLIDTSRDIGLDAVNGVEISAYLIDGNIFDGRVTNQILHVKQVRLNQFSFSQQTRKSLLTIIQLLLPVPREQCDYIRCLGLNYADHARV